MPPQKSTHRRHRPTKSCGGNLRAAWLRPPPSATRVERISTATFRPPAVDVNSANIFSAFPLLPLRCTCHCTSTRIPLTSSTKASAPKATPPASTNAIVSRWQSDGTIASQRDGEHRGSAAGCGQGKSGLLTHAMGSNDIVPFVGKLHRKQKMENGRRRSCIHPGLH